MVGVDVLFVQGAQMVEVGWRIESAQIPADWIELRGTRHDAESGDYVEAELPGWRARLVSVDEQSAGGDPIAITIAVKRAPGD